MTESDQPPERGPGAAQLLHQGASAEKRLLKQERKAERRLEKAREALADDETRLQKAHDRAARSREAVAAAEAALREAQMLRAMGPARSTD
jgi:hypothetical protein